MLWEHKVENSLLYIDDLTGVFNRRYITKLKVVHIPELTKSQTEFSIIVADIDHFKTINDAHGHLVGDEILSQFASYLKENLRKKDLIIRYGGDEFLIFQPELSAKDAVFIWNKLVEQIKKEKFRGLSISMSAGISTFPKDGSEFETLFNKADDRLYLAKRSGRGRVGTEEVKKIRIPALNFVNRKSEFEGILAGIENGEIVLVKGDAGIGKTRLITETLRTFKNIDVLWSDCLAIDHKISYYPLRELIKYRVTREGFGIFENMPVPFKIEISKIIPELQKDINTDDVKVIGESLDRYRLYESFNFVFNLGEKKKVIVIDNFQWIDGESIDALKYIMLGNKGKIVFILAQRSEKDVEYVERFINGIQRTYTVRKIYLSPLKQEHVNELVRSIVGGRVDSLEDYVWQRSAGNPFYVEELVKTLNREGYLKTDGPSSIFKEPKKDLLPGGIEGVIREKYNGLSHDAKEFLNLLSVVGKGHVGLIKDILGFREGYVFGLIEEGIKSTLIREDIEGGWVEFRYGLARKIIYNTELSEIKRSHLHKKVAQWLEANSKTGNEEEIAYHYRLGDVKEKVIEYGEKAGDIAQKLYSDKNALHYYGWVEEEIRDRSAENPSLLKKYINILIKKASVLRKIGNFMVSENIANKALEIARDNGYVDIEKIARSMLKNIMWNMGKIENAIESFVSSESGEKLKKEKGELDKNGGLFKKKFGGLGKVLDKSGKVKELTDSVKNQVEKIGGKESGLTKGVLDYINKAKNAIDNYTTGIGSEKKGKLQKVKYTDSKEIAVKLGYRLGKDLTLDNIAVLFAASGDFNSAERYLTKVLNEESIKSSATRRSYVFNNLGMVYRAKGELKKALKYILDAEKLTEKIGDKVGEAIYKNNIASILIDIGSLSTAEDLIRETYGVSIQLGIPAVYAEVVKNTIKMYEARGEYQKALLVLDNQEIANSYMDRRDLLLLKANVLLLSEQYNELSGIISQLSDYFKGKSPLPFRIEYEFLKVGYYLGVKDEEKTMNSLDKLYYILKTYPDKLSWAMYYRYSGMVYCNKNRLKALKQFEKSIELYKEAGLKMKAEKVLLEEKRCYGFNFEG